MKKGAFISESLDMRLEECSLWIGHSVVIMVII